MEYAGRGTSPAGAAMAAYALDLRKRVLRAWDSGMDVYALPRDRASRGSRTFGWVGRESAVPGQPHQTGSSAASSRRRRSNRNNGYGSTVFGPSDRRNSLSAASTAVRIRCLASSADTRRLSARFRQSSSRRVHTDSGSRGMPFGDDAASIDSNRAPSFCMAACARRLR